MPKITVSTRDGTIIATLNDDVIGTHSWASAKSLGSILANAILDALRRAEEEES